MGNPEEGFVTMDVFDPLIAKCMTELREKMRAKGKGGSIIWCWIREFDTYKTGKCNLEQFEEACKRIGYTRNPKKVYKWLDLDQSGNISLEEIDEKAAATMERGDHLTGLEFVGERPSQDSRQKSRGSQDSRRDSQESRDSKR